MENNSKPLPEKVILTANELADHDRSVHDYPNIEFGPKEYVIIDVQRSIWGLVRNWTFSLIIFVALVIIVSMVDYTSPVELNWLTQLGLLLITVIVPLAAGIISSWVYNKNRFIVTNERIFSELQYSPFAKRRQNVEINRIEDCSFLQTNVFQVALNYGSIRLSTVGDEQTYIFSFVDHPKEQFKIVNNAVKRAEDGQPPRRLITSNR